MIANPEIPPPPDKPKKPARPSKKPKRTYRVYVIELEPKVYQLRKKMRDANPKYKPMSTGKGCLYVGMTAYSPVKRFLVHMDGGKHAAKVVTKFGRHLRPDLYKEYKRMTKADAEEMERYLAARLRKRGYAVWPVKEGGAFTMNGKTAARTKPGGNALRRPRRRAGHVPPPAAVKEETSDESAAAG